MATEALAARLAELDSAQKKEDKARTKAKKADDAVVSAEQQQEAEEERKSKLQETLKELELKRDEAEKTYTKYAEDDFTKEELLKRIMKARETEPVSKRLKKVYVAHQAWLKAQSKEEEVADYGLEKLRSEAAEAHKALKAITEKVAAIQKEVEGPIQDRKQRKESMEAVSKSVPYPLGSCSPADNTQFLVEKNYVLGRDIKASNEALLDDVGDMRNEVATVKQEMATKDEVAAIQKDVATVKQDVASLTVMMAKVVAWIDEAKEAKAEAEAKAKAEAEAEAAVKAGFAKLCQLSGQTVDQLKAATELNLVGRNITDAIAIEIAPALRGLKSLEQLYLYSKPSPSVFCPKPKTFTPLTNTTVPLCFFVKTTRLVTVEQPPSPPLFVVSKA